MRTIKITQETAERWYHGTDAELKQLAIQTYPELEKKKLPKTWEELGEINGWCTTFNSFLHKVTGNNKENNKNIFATKEQAKASISLAQLSQLMKVYNDGWEPDWKGNDYKYCIYFYKGELSTKVCINANIFLAFKDGETAELFLEKFRDLITKAKPLL